MADHIDTEKKSMFSNEVYDLLSRIVKLGLPGLGAFYFTVSQLFGLPYGTQVVALFAALAVLGGIFLEISNRSYNNTSVGKDGIIVVDPDAGIVNGLVQRVPFDVITGKDVITLKVDRSGSPVDSQ